MITFKRMRARARHAWRLAQARLVIAQVERRQAQRQRAPNPGYDELRCPWFVGVMLLALLVLVIDVPDHWPVVIAFLASMATGG